MPLARTPKANQYINGVLRQTAWNFAKRVTKNELIAQLMVENVLSKNSMGHYKWPLGDHNVRYEIVDYVGSRAADGAAVRPRA